jgi:hypothetical protein
MNDDTAPVGPALAAWAAGRIREEELTEAALLDFQVKLAAPPVVHEPVDRTGVHATHCCTRHGCKYGNAACPVKAGTVAQVYACEHCFGHEPPKPITPETTTDELLHLARELTTLAKRSFWDEVDNMDDAMLTLVELFDEIDRRLSTHGSALPGAWAAPEGETP